MIKALNAFRMSHGVGALRTSPQLARSAESYSEWMAHTGFFGHRPRQAYLAAGRRFGCFGEVLARHRGRGGRVRRTLREWERSPAHRAVILNPSYDWVGAGRARGVFHGSRSTVWTVEVGCSARG